MEQLLLINPRKRKAKRAATKKRTVRRRRVSHAAPARRVRRKRNPITSRIRRRTHRRKHNPISGSGVMSTVMPALQGAGGAIALELVLGNLPLPVAMKTGMGKHLTKMAGAVALGMLVSKFGQRQLGKNMALGAMTCAFHDAIKPAIQTAMPTLKLAEVGYASPSEMVGYDPRYLPNTTLGDMGEYLAGNDGADFTGSGQLGEMNEYIY